MAIRQVITFNTQSGKGKDFAEGFAPIIAAVLEQPGCEQYEMFQSLMNPDKFVFLERWADQQSLDAALQRLYPGPDHPSMAFLQYIEGAPVREAYEI
jgi:quinol monooxygenase YgiN